jgi:hypothetical protein
MLGRSTDRWKELRMTPSRIWGLAKQRYVKSHRIFAKCRCIKDLRRFRNSQVGDLFSRSVLGVDSDRILKLVLREIILSQKIQMPPGSRRAMGHREDQKKAATETRKLVEKSVGSWQHWAKRNQQVEATLHSCGRRPRALYALQLQEATLVTCPFPTLQGALMRRSSSA